MWVDAEYKDASLQKSILRFCPYADKYPTVRPGADKISMGRDVVLSKFDLVMELYDGIVPF